MVLTILLTGCSTDYDIEFNTKEQRETLLKKILNSPEAKIAQEKNSAFEIQNLVNKEFAEKQMKSPTYYGPYEIVVPAPAPFLKNQKIMYQGSTNYPTPGMYYADLYNFKIKVQVPANAFAQVTSVYQEGYSNYNSQTSTGFNQNVSTENGNWYLNANTYTIALMYNSIGQYLGMVVPAPSTSKKFTYGYWVF